MSSGETDVVVTEVDGAATADVVTRIAGIDVVTDGATPARSAGVDVVPGVVVVTGADVVTAVDAVTGVDVAVTGAAVFLFSAIFANNAGDSGGASSTSTRRYASSQEGLVGYVSSNSGTVRAAAEGFGGRAVATDGAAGSGAPTPSVRPPPEGGLR